MPEFNKTDKNRVRRSPERGIYDKETIYKIIDEAYFCHVGIVIDGKPVVIPTIHARNGNQIIFHGAKASRMLKYIKSGREVCLTFNLLDGLVLARSVFHHTMNYRSVVLFGKGIEIEEREEKLQALEIFSENLFPGRWGDARLPNEKELKQTSVVSIEIEEASAKVRAEGVKDEEEDYDLNVWAGVLLVNLEIGNPEADPKIKENIELPGYLKNYKTKKSSI
jgi:nitroimidazol reductase NimA-like FMN-containing flavoprotein (pyridoxamine 5'-phosphate oxidase superfamily)